jgi:hypothetical protein
MGKYRNLSDETRRKMSEAHKGKKPPCSFLGLKHTDEWKKKMSERLKGRVFSEETRKKMSIAMQGKSHPHTEEEKRKIGDAHRGRPKSEEHKEKISTTLTNAKRIGEKSNNWKGGITPETRRERCRFRKRFRLKVLKRDNHACVLCGKQEQFMHVDHILLWSEHPELRFDMNNCRTLCESCHYQETYGKKKPEGVDWNGYRKCIGQVIL